MPTASSLLAAFAPPPEEVIYTEPSDMRPRYRYWRIRQLYTTFIGYALFYFVRQNMSVAAPFLESQQGISKSSLGLMWTSADLTYGVSKFCNGMLADRANPRLFMALGLIMCALFNLLFGASHGFAILCAVWILNSWFQGMGFPPVARVLAHWFSPKERGTMWAMWNASHNVGAAGILVLAGALAYHFQQAGNLELAWRSCFVVPALLALVGGVFVLFHLRDTPGSLGLPPVEVYTQDETVGVPQAQIPHHELDPEQFRRFLRRRVFGNPYIWLVAIANFFVYVIRYGVLKWGPTYLVEARHLSIDVASNVTAGFELFGLVGMFIAGYITDRFFHSRRAPVCFAYMAGTALFLVLFWQVPPTSIWTGRLMLWMVGFLDYGPQFLVGVMVTDLATKQAAATAIGLTGLFGYASGVISGWGIGRVQEVFGWNGVFVLLIGCAVAGAIPFALSWNARPTREDAFLPPDAAPGPPVSESHSAD
jgi:OPA family glycerol-3-phosphate transporter-like MFS transporter/OPA family sugar phosphate sensor protein UhpC-like MFS transporter